MLVSQRVSRALVALACILPSTLTAGCASLRLDVLRQSAARPSQVAAYFTIERMATRQAVGGLPVERFSVFEDGTAVPPLEGRFTLLDPTTVAAHYTIVLVDAGGAAVRGGMMPSITAGVRSFVERAGDRQRIAVYAFDGESTPRLIAARGTAAEVLPQLAQLESIEPRDSSTNLHGAVVWGVQQLDRELTTVQMPLKFGTLVVFTATRDIADRVTAVSMTDAVSTTQHEVYAAGVGRGVDARFLATIGRTQSFYSADPNAAQSVLDQTADRVAARAARHYFLSYCSPLRADRHRVRIEAREEGGAFGTAEFDIDATGFRANCDATTAPAWGQRAPATATAPESTAPNSATPSTNGGESPAPTSAP